MKKFSRLTALLLAITMLVTSMPLMALADSITVDIDTWNSWVEEAQNAAANQTETVTTTVPVTGETSVVDRPVVEAALTAHAGTETSATQAATLPIAGKLVLKAFDGASSYQWQVKAGSQWANIVGDKGATVTLTYAKVQNAISGGAAQVRCVMVVDGQDYVSATAQVTVDETVTYTTVETESTLTVTAEVPVRSNYALRNSGATTYNDTPSTYTVVINYVFEDNGIAADPYTASLAAGSAFSATVTFPTVQGYLPHLNDVQQDSLVLNFTAIDKDYTYNVVYKPTNVDYTVIHYQQNLNDDNYTEATRETKQGLTNSTVPEVAKTYEGFYALLYEKPEIAADGSTVVEVYYDRYYYLMNFDLDGGYGVEPIYARYGGAITDVGEPTKAGYSFGGWSLNGTAATLPDNMPAENRIYKAVWQADATAKVTVVFWGENADDEEYSYITSTQIDVATGSKYTYTSGTIDVYTCGQVEHNHTAECYRCGQEEHLNHTITCYDKVGNQTNRPSGAPWFPDEGEVYQGWINAYIYINGNWYYYTGDTTSGNIAPYICSGIHEHNDSCLKCGKEEHTHNTECKGFNDTLWTFKKSDTVTVAADGSSVVNVYYDRVEYDVRFYSRDNRNPEYTNLRITAKWGASILDKWPTVDGSSSWYVASSGDTWQNSIQIMPVGGAKFYGPKKGSSSYKAYYYVEVLPGEEGEDHNGVTYKLHHTDVSSSSGNVTDEERYEIKGFTYKEGTSNGQSYNNAEFYYTRNSYKLTFNDGYNDVKTESVKYQASLSSFASYAPAVPSAYEPGSVTFGGWYLNPECTGAEYELNKHTMPADNVLLYAKWVPVTHKVVFYLDKAALDAGTKLSTHQDITVPHGSKADPTPANPTNGSYTFVGWFYMENGVEKAFDFANMPVNKDLQVYGKWSSNVLKEYTILYKYKDTEGNEVEIAAPTTGSGLAGITKTFEAKGGTDLYADYQEGYFPVAKSHSMTIDINATKENDTNVYTFWYVQKDAVPYTVKYLNKKTGESVADEKTVSDNRKAVVTETFVPVSGYLPDAYQKRLVVSVDENGNPDTAKNVIIFYYTKDDAHAYYKITHYTENLAKDSQGNTTWTEYASSTILGNVEMTDYSAQPLDIDGFTYQKTEYVVSGVVQENAPALTQNGLEINLYYVRNEYPFVIHHYLEGTTRNVASDETGKAKYGDVISRSPYNNLDYYEPVKNEAQTLNIRIEENDVPLLNVITFYYKEKEVTINYEVVGPTGCGTVSPTSETLKVLSGAAQGSTPTANENFKFVGWYTDAACQTPVDSTWVDANNKIKPVKAEGAAWENGTTYYAKFEYNLTTLTITKEGMQDIDAGQSFLFKVKGPNLPPDGLLIAINGNGSETISGLLVDGEYTVTEVTDWSWRYTAESKSVTLGASDNVVKIKNEREKQYWLDGDCYAQNVFNKQGNVQGE